METEGEKNLYLLNPGDHGHQAHHPGNLLFFKVSQQVLDTKVPSLTMF